MMSPSPAHSCRPRCVGLVAGQGVWGWLHPDVYRKASCKGLTAYLLLLQVVKNLDSILERNLKVKHAGAGAGARRR